MQGAQVPALVGKLSSLMPHSVAPQNEKESVKAFLGKQTFMLRPEAE